MNARFRYVAFLAIAGSACSHSHNASPTDRAPETSIEPTTSGSPMKLVGTPRRGASALADTAANREMNDSLTAYAKRIAARR
jgi:hypothetical protein